MASIKVGDLYPVWWYTGKTREDGHNMAVVIEVRPYVVRYPEIFYTILKLSAPHTKRGWVETAVMGK